MSYFMKTELTLSFTDALARVKEELQKEGFGVLTEIDMKETLKKKLGVEMQPYHILGACNPSFAHKALQVEPLVGLLLPCNVVVQERGPGVVEVATIDPVVSMQRSGNPKLADTAAEVREKLERVLSAL